MTGRKPVQREESVVNNPSREIAADLRSRVDRLLNTAEGKFQYIRYLQGDPITNLEDTRTLTLVVNAHAPVLDQLVRAVSVLGVITAELLTTQDKLLDNVMELADRVASLQGSVSTVRDDLEGVRDELAELVDEVDQRTLIIPDTPEGL